MSPKERVRTVLERGKADRIPVALISDSDYQCQAAGYDHRQFRCGDTAMRAEIQRRFFLRHEANDLLLCWRGLDKETERSRKLTRQGDRYFVTDLTTGKTQEVEEWKTAANPHRQKTSCGVVNPITCEADIDRVLGPRPTANEVLESGRYDPLRTLTNALGDAAFLVFACGGVFPPTVNYLGGFDRAMETLATNPSLVGAIVEEMAYRNVANIRAATDHAPDGMWLHAYLEGTDLISPKHWRDLVLPGHRILVDEAKSHGLKVLMWFLGDCMPLLEDIVELGVDALVVEQPRRGYSSDPGEIRRAIGKRLCVFGWSPELAMINGDREAISRVVEGQIRSAGLDGAFAMGSTYLTNEISCETVDHYCNEVVRSSRRLIG